jgi:hypothetical protein
MRLGSTLAARLLLLIAPCACNVYTYADVGLRPDVISYRRVGMWAPDEAPASRSRKRDEGSSSVSFQLTFRRTDARRAGLVQILVFNAEQLPRIGASVYGRRQYCCTASLAAKGSVQGCTEAGQLIVEPEAPDTAASLRRHHHIATHDVLFAANQSEAAVSQRVLIKASGVHYLLLSSCEPRTGEVRFSGQTTWRNPHGFLPAELYPFLPFFGFMTAAYALLSLFWAFSCVRHLAALLPLQTAIAGVLLLSVAESATWFATYRAFNDGGVRGLVPTVLAVLISTVRKTVARLLVLTVCLGYGVVRPTLGSASRRVAMLGALYFATCLALDVASNITRLDELSLPTRLLFVLPVGLMDACYFWWCGSSLSRTLSQLSSRRQSAKLQLYRRFAHVLFATLSVSALWVSWQMLFIVSDTVDSSWSLLWTFDAFWHVLHGCVLLTICVLWSPSRNNQQYAYMDGLGQDAPDEDDGSTNGDGDTNSCDGSTVSRDDLAPYAKRDTA